MPRRLILIAAWLGATFIAVVVASVAVGAVRGEVTDQPRSASPFFVESVDEAAAEGDPTTSTSSTTTTQPEPTTTTTTQPEPTTTPPTQPEPTTTTSTQPESTTTTTTLAEPLRLPPYQTAGGTVTIEVLDPYVWLVGAVPNVGFTADVEHGGPEKVEVEFEAEDANSEFHARWEAGQLIIDIEDE